MADAGAGAGACQGCGAPLPSPEAVCPHCEAELAAPPDAAPGLHVCPQCHGRFAAPARAPWPSRVPWWRPTTMRLQCPLCDAPLRDRYAVEPPRWLVLAVIVAGVALQLFTIGWLRLVLGFPLLALLLAPLLLTARQGWKHTADPHRYVPGLQRFWAQGNEQLEGAVRHLRRDTRAPRP